MAPLAKTAATQSGVVSVEQLRELGFSRRHVGTLSQSGYLHRLHRGVYAVGHRKLDDRAYLMAALLAIGPEGFLSHRTAAAVYGLRLVHRHRVDVSVPRRRRKRAKGIVLHQVRESLHPEDVSTRDGLRVSSVPRLLVELARTEQRSELLRLVTQAIRKNLLDLSAIERTLERHPRRPGIAKLKHALRAYRPIPDRKSDLERAFDALLREHPDIPEPLRNVDLAGWEIDCFWPAHRLAVELDGRPYHIAASDFERDRLKDTALQRLGIRIVRITGWRFEHDQPGILADLRSFTTATQAA